MATFIRNYSFYNRTAVGTMLEFNIPDLKYSECQEGAPFIGLINVYWRIHSGDNRNKWMQAPYDVHRIGDDSTDTCYFHFKGETITIYIGVKGPVDYSINVFVGNIIEVNRP